MADPIVQLREMLGKTMNPDRTIRQQVLEAIEYAVHNPNLMTLCVVSLVRRNVVCDISESEQQFI